MWWSLSICISCSIYSDVCLLVSDAEFFGVHLANYVTKQACRWRLELIVTVEQTLGFLIVYEWGNRLNNSDVYLLGVAGTGQTVSVM